MRDPFYTLAIETSCDETAVALLRNQTDLLSNLVYSQAKIHARTGGVVPEVASRDHLRKLPYLVDEALAEAGISLEEISLIAVTYGPGLIGPLLVGLSHGKGMAFGLGVPLIGVNHLEGHLFAHRLHAPHFEPPFMALIVSGGHTSLVAVDAYGSYRSIGATVDDAAGEALDKVGKMMGIDYPAGAEIDRLASLGDPSAIRFPRPTVTAAGFDFSFAGLKTSVLYYLKDHRRQRREDVLASFLESVVDVLATRAVDATRRYHLERLVVVGGVAANTRLRGVLTERAASRGIEVMFPPSALCTDNAAMISAAGAFRYLEMGESHDLSLTAVPGLHLA